MCYSECHNVGIFPLKEVTYSDEWNHIGKVDETSRHLVWPFANSVRDTEYHKYHKRCSEDKHLEDIKWEQGSSFSVAHK